jgi:hypothetical protein
MALEDARRILAAGLDKEQAEKLSAALAIMSKSSS